MSTDSIGSDSRDHTTPADWWAAIPTTVLEDETGEMYNDSEFAVTVGWTFTGKTEGAFQLTLTTASGESLMDDKTNPLRYDQSLGVAAAVTGNFNHLIEDMADGLILSKIQFKCTTDVHFIISRANVDTLVERCLFQQNSPSGRCVRVEVSGIAQNNCIIVNTTSNTYNGELWLDSGGDGYFNTICVPADVTSAAEMIEGDDTGSIAKNNAVFGSSVASVGTFDSASEFNATDDSAIVGTDALTSLTYADQFIDSSTNADMDLRVKAGSDLIAAGVAVSGITTDIFGTTRADPPTIGCFEYEAAGSSIPVLMHHHKQQMRF